jgi:DNA-binding XRE family transcriptional regulator
MSPAHPAHAERRHAFGAQLRQARRAAGLTQKQLALGVSIADLVAGLT